MKRLFISFFPKSFIIILKILVVLMAIVAGLYLIFGPGVMEQRSEDKKSEITPQIKDLVENGKELSAMDMVEILSDLEFRGRKTGGKGFEMAATFVEGMYKELGLVPLFEKDDAGDEDGYRQYYEHPYNELRKPFDFELIDARGVSTAPTLGEDYIFDPSSNEGSFEEKDMVFIGYGVIDKSKAYNDFEGVDISDSVAVATFRLPENFSPRAYQNRVKNVEKRGGDALIYIVGEDDENLKENIFSNWWSSAFLSPIPILWVDEDIGDGLLAPSSFNIKNWKEDHEIRQKSRSFPLDYQANIEINNIRDKKAMGINIMGKKLYSPEYPTVLLTAHLDSLGVFLTEEDFPGANDNASGVGVLLEVMSEINRKEKEYPFNIMLVAFGGEEDSLKGSRHFLANLPLEPEDIKEVINLDMVGGGSSTLKAKAREDYGASNRLINALQKLEERNKNIQHTEAKPNPESDHWPFMKKGYSTTLITRPPIEEGEKIPYHTTEDRAEIVREEYLLESKDIILDILDELAGKTKEEEK